MKKNKLDTAERADMEAVEAHTVFSYLKMFVDMGMNVKFIGDNFCKHEPYTTILEQMGIEVLYGEKYANDGWKKWIDENAQYIDVATRARPMNCW